jgi:hypothetical protein
MMAARQSEKRGEAAPIHLSAGAEALALGTAAGSLILGALQVHEAQVGEPKPTGPAPLGPSLAEDMGWRTDPAEPHATSADTAVSAHAGIQAAHSDGTQTQDAAQAGAAATNEAAPNQVAAHPAPQAAAASSQLPHIPDAPPTTAAEPAANSATHAVAAPASLADLHLQMTNSVADQISSSVGRILDSIQAGQPHADLGTAIAQDIKSGVAEFVQSLETGLSSHLAATTDTGSAGASHAMASLLDDLPAALLGHEGPDGSGGFLSEIFYSDGQSAVSPTPAPSAVPSDTGSSHHLGQAMLQPVLHLSDSATSLFHDAAPLHLGFLAQSYIDAGDGHYAHTPTTLSAVHLI